MKNVEIQPESVEDIIKSMEGQTTTHGEPLDLIWRLANAYEREITYLWERLDEVERYLGV